MSQANRRAALLFAPALAVVMLALLALAPAGQASSRQASIMMDDDLMLYSGDVERDATLEGMRKLGVDSVRVTVLWRVFAPRRRPADPRNPAQYNSAILNRLDRLVIGAKQRGIVPYFNVTWPGPTWGRTAVSNTELRRLGTFRPRRVEFAKFVEMLGRRYSGTYRDENDGRHMLPRVNLWSIGNEPNQGGWLTPQSVRSRGKWIPMAPHLYRELYVSARSALSRTGHDVDQILIGELAPLGVSNSSQTNPLRPLKFLREMACLDRNYRRYRGRSATIRRCNNRFARAKLRATGIAYHPYTRRRSPASRPANRDEATISNLSRLTSALDRISRRTGGRVSAGLPVWITEFGYETNPPDRFRGVSPERQAEYSNRGDFIAYRNRRVASTAQFLFRDASPNRRFRPGSRDALGTYQSGLFYSNSVPKPAFGAYGLPIHVGDLGGGRINVWGQLRFRPNFGQHGAEIQFRPEGSANWVPLEGVQTNNPLAFFEKSTFVPGNGAVRVVWRDDGGTIQAFSRDVPVRKR